MAEGTEGTRAKVQKRKIPKAPPPRSSRASEVHDTKGDDDRRRAESYKATPKYRQAVRDTYAEQDVPRRRELLKAAPEASAPAKAIHGLHDARQRAQRAVDAAERWSRRGGQQEELDDEIRKGLRVAHHQATNAAGRALIAKVGMLLHDRLPSSENLSVEAGHKEGGLHLPVLGDLMGTAGALLHGKKPGTVQFGREIERTKHTPGLSALDEAQLGAMRGTLDATSKVLSQLSRVSSASAGATLAATEGKNPLKGAWEGLTRNDKSYTQVAEKLGLHGAPATIVGMVGDIALDPTTYVTFGLKAPAEAAEIAARQKLAREFGGAAKKAAKAGDEAAVARIHATWQRRIDDEVAKTSKLEDVHRGVQVGLRAPGGRQVATKGRLTAKIGEGAVGKAAGHVQQLPGINETLRAFSPAQRPRGTSRADHLDWRRSKREAAALESKIAREGRNLGRLIQDATGGDLDRVRAIVDAVESGHLETLTPKLRDAADRAIAFHDDVAARFHDLTGRDLKLAETVIPAQDVGDTLDLARSVLDASLRRAQKGVEHAESDLAHARVRNDAIDRHGDPRRSPAVRAAEAARDSARADERRATDAYASARVEAERARGGARVARTSDGVPLDYAGRLTNALIAKDEALVARTAARANAKAAQRALDRVVRETGRVTDRDAAFAARRQQRLTDAEAKLSRADELRARLTDDRPMTQQEERRLVDELQGVVDDLTHAKAQGHARERVNDFLGALRTESGDVGEWGELRAALREEDSQLAAARRARADGDAASARAASAKAGAARQVIADYREALEEAAGRELGGDRSLLEGSQAKLARVVERIATLAEQESPTNYLPRQLAMFMQDEKGDPALRVLGNSQAESGFEQARLQRGRMADIRESHPDRYSEELPLLEAKYGADMGRRLANLSLYKAILEKHASPATLDAMRDLVGGDVRLFAVTRDGKLKAVDREEIGRVAEATRAEEEAAARDGRAPVYDHVLVPAPIAQDIEVRLAHTDKARALEGYDAALRTFKTFNTVMRPGFFATTLLGNHWQQFLLDLSPKEMMGSYRLLAGLRHETLDATRTDAVWRKKLFDKVMPGRQFVTPEGPRSLAEMIDDAMEDGAARTGSRLGDPNELTLERVANRQLGGNFARASEWLGSLAEDLDDMARLSMYIRARTKLGMDRLRATEFTFAGMIDYGDLSEFERTVMKRVMPFYVYTSRNIPMQIRRLLARPGKLANFEKVRQSMAQLAGLPDDWESTLATGDQERMPWPVPGLKAAGFQWYEYLRLPVEDLSRPMQLADGPGGAGRIGTRYLGDLSPLLKAGPELYFDRRFDFDRPIDLPGRPPEAGALLRLQGLTTGEYVNPRTGEKYTATNAKLDYLLRTTFGSYGSMMLGIGQHVEDRSNIPHGTPSYLPGVRNLISFLAGQGANAPDPLAAVEGKLIADQGRLIDERKDLEGRGLKGREPWFRVNDEIDKVQRVLTKARASEGFADAQAKLPQAKRAEITSALKGSQSYKLRELMYKLDRLRSQPLLP